MPSTPGQPATATTDPLSPSPTTALPSTMFAACRRRYGGPEQVAVDAVPRPEPGPGEVLVRVTAAGLDRASLHLLTGTPHIARLALGPRRPRQHVLGQQVAGEVVALGPGTNPGGCGIGARAFGVATGSFAAYAVAKPAELAPTPTGVGDAAAATLGVSGMTALEAVDSVDVHAGQRVLVLGASGAVGGYAVQLAALRGAHVTAVCSGAKLDFVRELGAHAAADYRTTALADLRGPFDAVIDLAGNRPLNQLRRVLTPRGALVIVGGESAGALLGGLHRNLAADVANRFSRQRLGWLYSRTSTAGCAELARLLATGELRTPIDRTIGLAGVGAALAAMQAGELRGHVVVRPEPDPDDPSASSAGTRVSMTGDLRWLDALLRSGGGSSQPRAERIAVARGGARPGSDAAELWRYGDVVAKVHVVGADAAELGIRLAVAKDLGDAGIFLTPLTPQPLRSPSGRLVSLWPWVSVVDPNDPDGYPWGELGVLLARLHTTPPPAGVPTADLTARPRHAVERLPSTTERALLTEVLATASGQDTTGAAGLPGECVPPTLVHGDVHLGQLGRRDGAWLLLDVDDLAVSDPVVDLARLGALWAAGLLPSDAWFRVLASYRATAPTGLPEDPQLWRRLDRPARLALATATARALATDEDHEVIHALLSACHRIAQQHRGS